MPADFACDWKAAGPEVISAVIKGGVLQIGKVTLDIIKWFVRERGPEWDTNTHNVIGALLEDVIHATGSNDISCIETVISPVLHAAQGIDAMRASSDTTWGHAQLR